MTKTKVAKVFLFGLVVGLILGIMAMFSIGCGGEVTDPLPLDGGMEDVLVADSVPPPTPDLLPSKIDPVQACYDIAKWVADKAFACSGDQQGADKIQKTLEDAWDCSTIKGLRDGVELYTVCQVEVAALTCAEFQQGVVPKSCQSQLQ